MQFRLFFRRYQISLPCFERAITRWITDVVHLQFTVRFDISRCEFIERGFFWTRNLILNTPALNTPLEFNFGRSSCTLRQQIIHLQVPRVSWGGMEPLTMAQPGNKRRMSHRETSLFVATEGIPRVWLWVDLFVMPGESSSGFCVSWLRFPFISIWVSSEVCLSRESRALLIFQVSVCVVSI
jgi:hypothetical protein